MAKSKNASTTKKTQRKTVKPKAVKQKVVEQKPEVDIKGYLVQVLFEREPIEKDIPVADIFYRRNANLIELQCHAPNYEADIEQIIAGDISIETTGNMKLISKAESPESWIINLYKSREFSGNPFIAKEAQELYEA